MGRKPNCRTKEPAVLTSDHRSSTSKGLLPNIGVFPIRQFGLRTLRYTNYIPHKITIQSKE